MELSKTCGNSAIQYDQVPPRDATFVNSVEQVIDCGLSLPRPIDGLTLKFPLGSAAQFIDPLQMILRARFQIRNADGTLLKEDKQLAPVCGLLGAMVNKMTVWANGMPRRTYHSYPYIYHVIYLLHHGKRWFKTLGVATG